jgi:hypothetical protein
MPDRSRKRQADLNRLAASIVDDATNEHRPVDDGKDPAAVALARAQGRAEGRQGAGREARQSSAESPSA